MAAKISVVITTYNEEGKIKDCLESVKWADEIVLVDNESLDKTVEIAKKYTDKIYKHKNVGYVEPVRNFAIDKATCDWVLILDADEQVPPQLAKELREIANNNSADCILLPRKNIIFGKWIKSEMWWPDYNVRFFKKGKVAWSDRIHSKPELKGSEFKLDPEEDVAIYHRNYSSVSEYLKKFDNYTTAEVEGKISEGYVVNPLDAIRFPTDDFLKTYFFQKGYKDGLHGLVLSLLQAFYMEVVFAKLWEKKKFEEVNEDKFLGEVTEEMKKSSSKAKYWMTTEMINNTKNPVKKIILKTSRKLSSNKSK